MVLGEVLMKKSKGKRIAYRLRNQKKLFRNIRRKINRKVYRRNKRNTYFGDNNFIGGDYYKIIGHLDNKKFAFPRIVADSKLCKTIVIPEVFSISADAESAIKLLRDIYTICRNIKIQEIRFDHSNCTNLGLSASTIMDIIVLATKEYREKQGKPLDFAGDLPRDKYARDILLASGLPYHLKADSFIQADESHIERLETIKGLHDLVANKAGETATKLTLYFNKCLKTQNMELNNEGTRLFSTILGEVISNCEIHGGKASTWYTQGHYQTKEDNSFGEMQLLFLNLGETIYEGLKNNSSEETEHKLHYLINHHKKYMKSSWDEEMIYTVFALQEGISRLRDSNINGYEGRGSGTVSMIEMFYDIGASKNGLKPQMTIVSGNTQIKFTEKYKMKAVVFRDDEAFGSGEKRIIAFNNENDIYIPANPENVIKMNQYFPGTVISLKFYLDSRYISSKKRKENK